MKRIIRAAKLVFFNPRLFIRKLRNEFSAPSNEFIGVIRKILILFKHRISTNTDSNIGRLLFIYDTRLNPITFDFLNNLYLANLVRHDSCVKGMDILLIFEENLTMRREESYILAIGADNINWRLYNMLIPLTRLFSSVGRIHLVEIDQVSEIIKSYNNIHPKGYSYANPKKLVHRIDAPGLSFLPSLRISVTAREIVAAYYPKKDNRRIITITLRTYDYISARNSDIKSWVEFASKLDPMKYKIIFIPDASTNGVTTIEKIDAFEVFDSACWNIELRAALYDRAWMNMGVVCGPLVISALMKDSITVMIDRSLDYPAYYFESIRSSTGAVLAKMPNYYSNSCYFYLGRDDLDTIQKLFDKHSG
jgi:hypothetical protein